MLLTHITQSMFADWQTACRGCLLAAKWCRWCTGIVTFVSLAQIIVVFLHCCHDCHSLQLLVLAGAAHTGECQEGTLLALAVKSVLPQDSFMG